MKCSRIYLLSKKGITKKIIFIHKILLQSTNDFYKTLKKHLYEARIWEWF